MPPQQSSIADLGQQLYDLALVLREQEHLTDSHGNPVGWLLDTRMPMLQGPIARQVGERLASRLRAAGVTQVAGYGFGAYPMVCAAVAAPGYPSLTGGFVRPKRKPYGRQRLIEGPIQRDNPLVLLDDILNSGRNALSALSLLRDDGFNVVGFMSIFEFTWSRGRSRLEREGLWVDALLELNQGSGSGASSDSA